MTESTIPSSLPSAPSAPVNSLRSKWLFIPRLLQEWATENQLVILLACDVGEYAQGLANHHSPLKIKVVYQRLVSHILLKPPEQQDCLIPPLWLDLNIRVEVEDVLSFLRRVANPGAINHNNETYLSLLECLHSPIVFLCNVKFITSLHDWRDNGLYSRSRTRFLSKLSGTNGGININNGSSGTIGTVCQSETDAVHGLLITALQIRNRKKLTVLRYLQTTRCVFAAMWLRLHQSSMHESFPSACPLALRSFSFSSMFQALNFMLPQSIHDIVSEWQEKLVLATVNCNSKNTQLTNPCDPCDLFDEWLSSLASDVLGACPRLHITCEDHFVASDEDCCNELPVEHEKGCGSMST